MESAEATDVEDIEGTVKDDVADSGTEPVTDISELLTPEDNEVIILLRLIVLVALVSLREELVDALAVINVGVATHVGHVFIQDVDTSVTVTSVSVIIL